MYSTQPNGAEGATINPATINPAALNSGKLCLASLSLFYCLFLSLRSLIRPTMRPRPSPVQDRNDPSGSELSKETRITACSSPRAQTVVGASIRCAHSLNQSINQINHMRPSRRMSAMDRPSYLPTYTQSHIFSIILFYSSRQRQRCGTSAAGCIQLQCKCNASVMNEAI